MNFSSETFDIIIFFIIFIFAFLAFLRGFIKDFFSTTNLILAFFASYALTPIVTGFLSYSNVPVMIIDLVARFSIFILILIFGGIVSHKIARPLSGKIPSIIDQSLGFGFGLVKGYFILSFLFSLILSFYSTSYLKKSLGFDSKKDKFGPKWMTDSKSYDILVFGSDIFRPIIGNVFAQVSGSGIKDNDNFTKENIKSIEQILQNQELYNQIIENKEGIDSKILEKLKNFDDSNIVEKQEIKDDLQIDQKTEEKNNIIENNKYQENRKGYTKEEREKMRRLIEIMSN